MDFDLRVVIFAGIALTGILWAIPIALQRVDARVTARGFRNGSVIATGIFLVSAVIVAILFDQGGAILLGVFVGLILALGYLWLGSLLIAIGLIFRAKPAWTTVGAWAAVPVIVVSVGFGYVSFRSVRDEGSSPPTYLGLVDLEVTGANLGSVHASGDAQCQYDSTGAVRVKAGTVAADSTLTTEDGRLVSVQFDLDAAASAPSLTLVIGVAEADPGKGWQPSPQTIKLAPGSTPRDGSATLTGLVPLGADAFPDERDRWSGQLTWSCAYSE